MIHLVNAASPELKPQELFNDHHHVLVASKAYSLSSSLMRILMKSRVLNEEPLELAGGEIVAKGKRSDPFNLLCYENTPDCQFSIPQAFNTTFSDLTDVIQVMFRVDSNPFPFGYISNYTVSTEVASMEFQTNNGTQIPIGSLDSEKAITVMVSNNTEAMNISAGTEVIPERTSVNLVVTTENNHREAGLHFQLTYRILNGRYRAARDSAGSRCCLSPKGGERRRGWMLPVRTAPRAHLTGQTRGLFHRARGVLYQAVIAVPGSTAWQTRYLPAWKQRCCLCACPAPC